MPTGSPTLRGVRNALLGVLVLGCVGTAAELALLEHFEDRFQIVPLAYLALILVAVGVHLVWRRRASARAVQAVTVLTVISGPVGTWFHYQANVEFKLEVTPSLAGWELFKAAFGGGIPALAPGTMVLLGLLGLVWISSDDVLVRPRTPPDSP
jgi:hypothetical protein